LFGVADADRLLERYHQLEPAVQGESFRAYREVLTETLIRLAESEELAMPEGESDALAKSLPEWPPFPEVRRALEEARRRGWRLAILSNTDRELIAESRRRIAVAFDRTITAEDVESYKPNHRHWEKFFARTEADLQRHVHVGASLYHDIAPATELGLKTVWINRLGEKPDPEPTRELSDLSRLPETLDELVP
jgi:2-haloacid dehalogenase